MGTVLALMGTYYLLNGQAFRAIGEVSEWLEKKSSHSNKENKQTS